MSKDQDQNPNKFYCDNIHEWHEKRSKDRVELEAKIKNTPTNDTVSADTKKKLEDELTLLNLRIDKMEEAQIERIFKYTYSIYGYICRTH